MSQFLLEVSSVNLSLHWDLNSSLFRTIIVLNFYHQIGIKEWWLNPVKYCQLIEAEQKKHPGKCLFHLTKSHQTSNCAVKKECDQIVASKSNNASSVSGSLATSGQLRHLTDDSSEEIVEESVDLTAEEQSNVTNDDVLHYFACITNHYLHLIKSNPSLDSRFQIKNIQLLLIAVPTIIFFVRWNFLSL
jgi:hypothetical protein